MTLKIRPARKARPNATGTVCSASANTPPDLFSAASAMAWRSWSVVYRPTRRIGPPGFEAAVGEAVGEAVGTSGGAGAADPGEDPVGDGGDAGAVVDRSGGLDVGLVAGPPSPNNSGSFGFTSCP